MHYALKNISLITIAVFMLTACSNKSYHNEMTRDVEKLVNEKSYDRVRNSYSEELVSEKNKNKEFMSFLMKQYFTLFMIQY